MSSFDALRAQLTQAATDFTAESAALAQVLTSMVDDVDFAMGLPLDVFPVCHHSPASAVTMARYLRDRAPKVIYLEMSEDLTELLPLLAHCTAPVALQAYAKHSAALSEAIVQSILTPVTEASAEYQAIVYALTTPGVELVLVDHSSDLVAQWSTSPTQATAEQSIARQVGDIRPRIAELESYLVRHGKVRHWSEWWHQYVEVPLAAADFSTYRQVMLLVGSLFRQLEPTSERLGRDEERERHMWARIRAHQRTTSSPPEEAVFVCGAFHAVSRLPEVGLGPDLPLQEPSGVSSNWQYGIVPTSNSAIDDQFGLEPGSVSIAQILWSKSLKRSKTKPWKWSRKATAVAASPRPSNTPDRLSEFLHQPPSMDQLDEAELLKWSVSIVASARRAGYLSSTADSIAIFETAILLAGIRDRAHPTAYDFTDAAITCLEKDAVPGRRSIAQLVSTMLGGDQHGKVGYQALPPLAQDVFDRLSPLGMRLDQRGVKRVLMDMSANPELADCSTVLWQLKYLLPAHIVRTIMGERTLGSRSIQESWDVSLGTSQRALIELGYEGVSLEHVVEQRLRSACWVEGATAADGLTAVEDAMTLLENPALVTLLGERSRVLLAQERHISSAPEVLTRSRRLVSYLRTRGEPPPWLRDFVTTGFAHYCRLLPSAFSSEESSVSQVSAAVSFVFSLQSLAVSFGCDWRQVELAIAAAHPTDPSRTALLWCTQVSLGVRSRDDLRQRFQELLDNPLTLHAYPEYVRGIVHGLDAIPDLADIAVEVVSNALGDLPDSVLLPWLPHLITALQSSKDLAAVMLREAQRTFPQQGKDLDAWLPPWSDTAPIESPVDHDRTPVDALEVLTQFPDAMVAVAAFIGARP